MKYYDVEAKCGHVGRNNYIIKHFFVSAENGKEAAYKTRLLPRVKHHHKDAIRSVTEIDYNEFVKGLDRNNLDPYFLVNNISEQRASCAFESNEIKKEEKEIVYKKPTHAKRIIVNKMLTKDWKSRKEYLYE